MYNFPIKDRVPTRIDSKFSYHIKTIGFNSLITNWFQQVLKQYSVIKTTSVDNLHIIESYINNYASKSLASTISTTYGLSDDYIYKITNIQFEHYNSMNPTINVFQKDESNITCRILIQTYSHDCVILFDDNLKHCLQEGDLVIYSDKNHYMIEYSGNICPIFLVFNIDIYSESTNNLYGNWPTEINNQYKDCI